MTAQADKTSASKKVGTEVAKTDGKFPYPFRTSLALLLLAINFLVAAWYFHIIE